MTPNAARVIDENSGVDGIADIVSAHVHIDASRVSDLIDEMAAQNSTAFYPLFLTMPADRVCIDVGDLTLICESNGRTVETKFLEGAVMERISAYLHDRAASFLADHTTIKSDIPDEVYERAFSEPDEALKEVVSLGEMYQPGEKNKWLSLTVSCAFDLIAQQNLFETKEGAISRPIRRRLERSGCAVINHSVIDFSRSYTTGTGARSEPQSSKALHFVVGHWRRSEGPKSRIVDGIRKTWIEGHWRGNPALGVVTKSYVTGRKFQEAIRA